MNKTSHLTLITTGLALALGLTGCATEERVAVSKLPPAVQTTVKQVVGSGTIKSTSREAEKDGRVLYEVAYVAGGRSFEAEISPEGKLLVVDEAIALAAAPDAVQKTILAQIAGGRIIKFEKATQGTEVFYEAEFKKGGKTHEVKVAPDGKVLAVE